MANLGFTSKRVKKKSQIGLTSDRYEFLGLEQAEPDLGDPIVGPSSIGANPIPLSGTKYVLISNSNTTGKRYWVPSDSLSTGLIPGSFTVYNNNNQIGLANSFNKFNFVGTGVTVDSVGSLPSDQTGIATIRISVLDVNASGDVNSIQYKASNGLLGGVPDFVYVGGNIGLGLTTPTQKLDILGNLSVSGTIFGNLVGYALSLYDAANIITGTISSSRLGGFYNISVTGTATTASGLTTTANINTSGIITASSFTGNLTGTATTASGLTTSININTSGIITATKFVGPIEGNLTGTATTATNLTPTSNINTSGIITATSFTGNLTGTAITASGLTTTANINTSGIITATKFYGDLYGNLSSTGTLFDAIEVTGISTFTNGPVLVGRATTTGTANQALQVESGAYISGNLGIGTTNPKTTLQVETYGIKTGVGTFTASVGVSTTLDSFTVSSTDFKTAEYTVHIGFGSYIQAQKILVMQDQTTAYAEEYAVMYNNSLLVSIGATISGGNCILQATPKTGVSGLTTYRFARNTLS